MPTETVYGLGADATQGKAVARIYALKSRPRFNPLIVHVATPEIARQYVEWNGWAETLATAFWPGPLTLVLKRRAKCTLSELVSAGGDTVGIRIPSHPIAQRVLRAWGGGIAAPSANRSGRISPTTAAHVRQEFGNRLPLIIDGGPSLIGLESTVIDLSGGRPALLRPGSITRPMVQSLLPLAEADVGRVLKSPGQLASHYAPSLPVRLEAVAVSPREALLAFGPNPLQGAATAINLSPSGDVAEAAANLFAALRALDTPDAKAIAVMPIPDKGIGEAINDRLRRAAAAR